MRKERPPKQKQRSRSARWEDRKAAPSGDQWFIAGANGVRECLASPRVKVTELMVDPRHLSESLVEPVRAFRGRVTELRGRETRYGDASQGIAALVRPPGDITLDTVLDQADEQGRTPFLVALDQVSDPMNLGQILRSCECAGVDALVLPKHRAAHMSQTTAQISQGAFAWVPVIEVTNLRNSLDSLKKRGLWVIGCDGGPDSQSWHRCDFTQPVIVVLGAEGDGMRALTRKTCDTIAALPMQGRLDSLNVGAAASAFFFEVVRQRQVSS